MASIKECIELVRELPAGQQKLVLWALQDYARNGGRIEDVFEAHGVFDHLPPEDRRFNRR